MRRCDSEQHPGDGIEVIVHNRIAAQVDIAFARPGCARDRGVWARVWRHFQRAEAVRYREQPIMRIEQRIPIRRSHWAVHEVLQGAQVGANERWMLKEPLRLRVILDPERTRARILEEGQVVVEIEQLP